MLTQVIEKFSISKICCYEFVFGMGHLLCTFMISMDFTFGVGRGGEESKYEHREAILTLQRLIKLRKPGGFIQLI